MSLFVLSLLAGNFPAAKSLDATYSISVRAYGIEGDEISGIPILLDGANSGFTTPHTFASLFGFHNFSVPIEDMAGRFVRPDRRVQSGALDEVFIVLSEGVNWSVVGPTTATNVAGSLSFTYGPIPFVELFRNAFEPGGIASLGLQVYMDSTRVANAVLEVYRPNSTGLISHDDPFYSSHFAIYGTQLAYSTFEIPREGPTGRWEFTVHTTSANFDIALTSYFEVADSSPPPAASFPELGELPYSTIKIGEMEYVFYDHQQSSEVVVLIGGGSLGRDLGPTPISGNPTFQQNSANYRLLQDLFVSGFTVVTPSTGWRGLEFPWPLIEYLRARGKESVYGVGVSAGGVVIANAIVNHPGLFDRAVIADAPLTKRSSGYFFTDLAFRAGRVNVPHLLIWGRDDPEAPLSDAYSWMNHANASLSNLEVHNYYHSWEGTTAETQARRSIVTFLSGQYQTTLDIGSGNQAKQGASTLGSSIPPLSGIGLDDVLLSTRSGQALISILGTAYRRVALATSILDASRAQLGIPVDGFLYPAILIASLAELVFKLPAGSAEVGGIAAIVVSALLLGMIYLGLPLSAALVGRPAQVRVAARVARRLTIPLGCSLSIWLVGLAIGLQTLVGYGAFGAAALIVAVSGMITPTLIRSCTRSNVCLRKPSVFQ